LRCVDRLDIYRSLIVPIDLIEVPRSYVTFRGLEREAGGLVAGMRDLVDS